MAETASKGTLRMERLRIGLVGASSFAETNHYVVLKSFPDVELVALCDIVEARAAEVAGRLGIERTYINHRQLLEKERLDAVYVITAPHHSYDIIADFLHAKVPVFTEKPGVLTSFQAESLAEIADTAGTFGMVAFNRRFMPALVEAKRLVCSNGPLQHCVATYYKTNVLRYYDGAIDFFRCDAIHAVDALRWMAGDAVEVVAMAAKNTNAYPHAINALIRFESGCTGVLMVNWDIAQRVHTFELHGHGCSAFVDPLTECVIITDSREVPERISAENMADTANIDLLDGIANENRYFVQCVKTGDKPKNDLADAAKTHRLVDRIQQSAVRKQGDNPKPPGAHIESGGTGEHV